MISTNQRASSQTPNGTETQFTFPYDVLDADHLSCTVDGLTVTNFTVALDTPSIGATVTFLTAPAANSTLIIKRTTPATQLVDYTAGERFPAEVHEAALDKLTLIAQEAADDQERSFKAPTGSTTNVNTNSTFFSKYLGMNASGDLVALEETVVVAGVGGSTFDLNNTSDVDVITVTAGGTTTITIPDADCTQFGAIVNANDSGGSSYTHVVKMPDPGSTGQRAFIQIRGVNTSGYGIITIDDENDVDLLQVSPLRGQYITDLRLVSTGSAWVIDNVTYGRISADRYAGAAYIISTLAELDTAIADTESAVLFVTENISFTTTDSHRTIPTRHKLVFAAGGRFDFFGNDARASLTIDAEVTTLRDDQQIFSDALPGTITGTFGGVTIIPEWFEYNFIFTALFGDWAGVQSAIYCTDIASGGNTNTVTNWNDSTNVITVADTNDFANGDLVYFAGADIPAFLHAGRPWKVINATSGAGSTLSTFQVEQYEGAGAVSFSAGGGGAVTVARAKASTRHNVKLRAGKVYAIARQISLGATGTRLFGAATLNFTDNFYWRTKATSYESIPQGSNIAFTKSDYGSDNVTITATAHGLSVGDPIVFPSLSTAGTLDTAGTWFVKTRPNANTFTIATYGSGSDVDLGANVAGNVALAGGGAPMLVIGETSGIAGDRALMPHVIQDVIFHATDGTTDLLDTIGSNGPISEGSKISGCEILATGRSYVAWQRDRAESPGFADYDDNSYLRIESCKFSGQVVPQPCLHLPGQRSSIFDCNIAGSTGVSPSVLYGANKQGVSIRDVYFSNARYFQDFQDDAAYLASSLDNVQGICSHTESVAITSIDTGTDVITSTAHGLSNGDVVRWDGSTGSVPTGWGATRAYFITNVTTNTFKVADHPNAASDLDISSSTTFTIVNPGALIRWRTAQANARVTGNALSEFGTGAILVDSTTHNRVVTGAPSQGLATGHRRIDMLTWSTPGFFNVYDGVVKANTYVMSEKPDQYPMDVASAEVALMTFITSGPERSLVLKVDDDGTDRWKFIKATLSAASPTWTGTNSDPQI